MGKESHYSSKKDRVFVRGIQGQYSLKDELKRLRSMPRVIKGRDLMFNDGPQSFSKHFVEPVDGLTQTLHVHLEEYAPGGRTQKHGHVNEAAFYILDGTGYEVHDGVRYDWKAGDVAIVHMNCVHQHFNADPDKPALALVMKPKPLLIFMNMNIGFVLRTSARAGLSGLALNCWCTQLLWTIAMSPAFQS